MKLKIVPVLLLCALATSACAAETDLFAQTAPEALAQESPVFDEKPVVAADAARLAQKGLNARAQDGSTPLILAARANDTALIEKLLKDGAKVNAKNKKGATALTEAAFFCEDSTAVKALIAAGADVNAADKEGWTPLMLALYANESTDAAEALLAAGAQTNVQNKRGWTPLMLALRTNKPAAFVSKMLKKWGAHAEDHKNAKDGTTPLMIACQYATDVRTVRELYAAGGEATRARRGGEQPLHFAARNGSDAATAIIRFLIDNRAEVDCTNGSGWTPLMTAAQFSSRPDVTAALLKAGARVNARKGDGMTPVMLAATNESENALTIARQLIDAGADLNMTDGRGRTAFEVAARSAFSLDMLKLLRSHEDASAVRKQNTVLAVAPAVDHTRSATRTLNAPLKRSLGFIPPKVTSHGEIIGGMLRSYDLLPESPDVSPDEQPSPLSADTAETHVGARLTALLRSYDVLPPVLSDDAVAAETPLSDDAVSEDNEAIVSADVLSAALVQASADVSSPDAAPLPVVTGASVQTPAEEEEDPFPEEQFAVADVLKAQDEAAREEIGEIAPLLAEALDLAAEARTAKGEDEVYPLSKVQTPIRRLPAGSNSPDTAILSALAKSARFVSRPAFNAERLKASQYSHYTKRRGLKKMRPQFRRDRTDVTTLMLAAVNPNDAAPEIITWLLAQGEQLEARDGEGRTALICAIGYNSSPLPAQTLIEAGADTRVRFNGNDLRRLLRFNSRMSLHDKKTLVPLLKK